MSYAYAIDFGTTNSLLAAAADGKSLPPVPLDATAPDPSVLRTILYTPSRDQWSYGAEAIDLYGELLAEGRIFRSIKKYLPDAGFTGTRIHGKHYSLHDLISVFLGEMRSRANNHFQQDVDQVVLGRPAAFSLDAEKDKLAESRLRAAAMQAGFKHIEFCPEPIAAASEFRHTLDQPKIALIADFGGGTSDFTVLKLNRDSFSRDDVLSVGGIPVAGDMFDGSIMKHMISPHFGSQVTYRLPMGSVDLKLPKHLINRLCSPADISFLAKKDIQTLLRDAQKWSLDEMEKIKMERLFTLIEEHLGYKLFSAIEDTKKLLSTNKAAPFYFHYYDIELKEEIFSSDFKVASMEHVTKIAGKLDDTINAAGLKPSDIEIVCCTGGTAQIPAVHFELARRFGEEKLRQHRHFHSVIGGLAERAAELY